jgi:ABC-type transport system substrate-binding protein
LGPGAAACPRGGIPPRPRCRHAFPDFGGLRTAQALRHQLKQIGLDLEIKLLARAVFSKDHHARRALGHRSPRLGHRHPGSRRLRRPVYGGPSITGEPYGNHSWFDNADVNRRIEAASRLSGEARYRAFQRLDVDVLRRHAPIVPIGSALWPWLAGPKLGCLFNHPYYLIDLAALCLE